jgi:hypothetical protein
MVREPMMIAVSLQVVLSYAFAVSAVFMALNYRGKSTVLSAGVLLVLCVLTGVEKAIARDNLSPTYRAIQIWLLFELLPTAAVWWVSRAGFAKSHPWSLLVVGPLVFLVALVTCLTVYGVARPR